MYKMQSALVCMHTNAAISLEMFTALNTDSVVYATEPLRVSVCKVEQQQPKQPSKNYPATYDYRLVKMLLCMPFRKLV